MRINLIILIKILFDKLQNPNIMFPIELKYVNMQLWGKV